MGIDMAQLRNGMWVRTSSGVGIFITERVAVSQNARRVVGGDYQPLEGETIEREPWVHLTNPDGTTLAQIPIASAGKVTQAALKDIPKPRRPSEADGARLGYAA